MEPLPGSISQVKLLLLLTHCALVLKPREERAAWRRGQYSLFLPQLFNLAMYGYITAFGW